jgi:hypothetical protein
MGESSHRKSQNWHPNLISIKGGVQETSCLSNHYPAQPINFFDLNGEPDAFKLNQEKGDLVFDSFSETPD